MHQFVDEGIGHEMTGPVSLFPRYVKKLFPGAETGARTLIHLASLRSSTVSPASSFFASG